MTVKGEANDVIIEARTSPDTEACWNQVNWSGDVGIAVPGRPNQRRLSRSASRRYHVVADLVILKDKETSWMYGSFGPQSR